MYEYSYCSAGVLLPRHTAGAEDEADPQQRKRYATELLPQHHQYLQGARAGRRRDFKLLTSRDGGEVTYATRHRHVYAFIDRSPAICLYGGEKRRTDGSAKGVVASQRGRTVRNQRLLERRVLVVRDA